MAERIHPTRIRWYRGTPEELGREIMRGRYDFVRGVIHGMALEALEQMQADSGRGRKRLAGQLYEVYTHLTWIRRALQLAWSLSARHMKEELKEKPELTDGNMPGIS